jgi:hypothetical protein
MDLRSAELIGRFTQALRAIAKLPSSSNLYTAQAIAEDALNSVGIMLLSNGPHFFTEETITELEE